MIATCAATPIRPGSMGRPLPGVKAALVARDETGAPRMKGNEVVLVSVARVLAAAREALGNHG